MTFFSSLDDMRTIRMKVDQKAHDLFKEKPGQAPLTVTRILNPQETNATPFEKDIKVLNLSDIKRLRNESKDVSQIFTINQDRSWTTLNTSREVFESFMSTYEIMPPFWRCVFTFGRKSEENEFEFPRFGQRRSRNPKSNSVIQDQPEFSYVLRRVELKNREVAEGDSPWSIRQTGVYHRLEPKTNACETLQQEQNKTSLQTTSAGEALLSVWNTHRVLLADSLRGWMDYMSYLEQRLKHQATTVGVDKVNLSPLTDFKIDFEDRQELKIIEDYVLDLQVILPGILDSITGVRDQCRAHLLSSDHRDEERHEMGAILGELNEYIGEVTMHIERAKNLKDKAKATAQLARQQINVSIHGKHALRISFLNANITQERSTKDAAAVKILTVITLIYLPTTIVANFFSTQFVQTGSDGQMRVSNKVWLLAAISVPMTFFTILLWWGWVHFTKVEPTVDPDQPGIVTLQRAHSFRSIVSAKKKQKDLESGLSFPTQSSRTPTFRHAANVPTWSSDATTVKAE
ncbi:hypothetical protein BGZ57DRAFT_763271 [Hyaloscypha finlandica]|nr:hypothetical protein BGZ57DRAFT_763271 [Hyaloscypha finlandica]